MNKGMIIEMVNYGFIQQGCLLHNSFKYNKKETLKRALFCKFMHARKKEFYTPVICFS